MGKATARYRKNLMILH